MPWHKIVFSPDGIGSGRQERFKQAFEDIFVGWKGPADAGLFQGLGVDQYMYYLSPRASEMMTVFLVGHNAVKCAAPMLSDLQPLLIGSLDAIPFADG